MLSHVYLKWGKGRAGGKDCSSLRVGVCCLCCALCLAGGVGQGKDDGLLVDGGHLLDDVLSEDIGDGCGSNEDGGFDVLDDLHEVSDRGMRMGKWFLGFTDASRRSVLDYQALGISEPNVAERLLSGHPLSLLHGHSNEVSNANGSFSSSLEEEGVICQLGVGGLE